MPDLALVSPSSRIFGVTTSRPVPDWLGDFGAGSLALLLEEVVLAEAVELGFAGVVAAGFAETGAVVELRLGAGAVPVDDEAGPPVPAGAVTTVGI